MNLAWVVGAYAGIAFGCIVLYGARCLKKKSALDIPLYFGLPFLWWGHCRKMTMQPQLFTIGFPADPMVVEERRKVLNKCCYYAPEMLKNEIEFMHSRVDGIQIDHFGEKCEGELARKLAEESDSSIPSRKYEKIFKTGDLGLSLINRDKTEEE